MENERLNEIEKKVDELFQEMEFHELVREPYDISKHVNNLKKMLEKSYIADLEESFDADVKRMMDDYFLDKGKKIKDRERLANKLLSDFLKKELCFSEEDIETIKEPFHLIVEKADIFDFIKRYNFEAFLTHKDRFIPFEQFKYKLWTNKCPLLSRLYSSSIKDVVELTNAQEAAYESKRSIELVFKEIESEYNVSVYKDSPEIEYLNKIAEGQERHLNNFIKRGKENLTRNIVEIERIYTEIRKNYKTLAEYFEKDL